VGATPFKAADPREFLPYLSDEGRQKKARQSAKLTRRRKHHQLGSYLGRSQSELA
jgi:hypothetical protein